MDDGNEELFVEFEDAIMDLAAEYKKKGLTDEDIISAMELRLMTLKESSE